MRLNNPPHVDRVPLVLLISRKGTNFKLTLLAIGKLFMKSNGVMGSGSKIMNAVTMMIIEFGKLFGQNLDGQKLILKRYCYYFTLGIVAVLRWRYSVMLLMVGCCIFALGSILYIYLSYYYHLCEIRVLLLLFVKVHIIFLHCWMFLHFWIDF